MIESLSLREMPRLQKLAHYESVRNTDYVFVHVTPESDVAREIERAIRFNGMIIALVTGGSIGLTVNMEYHRLKTNNLMITGPSSIITIDTDSIDHLEAFVLFVSVEFLHDLNFEIVNLNALPVTTHREPYIRLVAEHSDMLIRYFDLLDANTRLNSREGNEQLSRSISRSLLTATLYQLMIISGQSNPEQAAGEEPGGRQRSRRVIYTHEFVRLVRKFFRKERTVKFYADKLCISPKYLSLVIKESTGRSAAEIIDEYVVLEAKNMLRFSSKNVQQVAYDLNFPNQSSFGKYFKHQTGMSPSEFQNS